MRQAKVEQIISSASRFRDRVVDCRAPLPVAALECPAAQPAMKPVTARDLR
jgi:hypothetical protein